MAHFSRLLYLLLILLLAACGDTEPTSSTAADEAAVDVSEHKNSIAPTAEGTTLPESYAAIKTWRGDLDAMEKNRTIRVLTVYSVGRYYLDNAEEKGLVKEFSKLFDDFINKRLKRKGH